MGSVRKRKETANLVESDDDFINRLVSEHGLTLPIDHLDELRRIISGPVGAGEPGWWRSLDRDNSRTKLSQLAKLLDDLTKAAALDPRDHTPAQTYMADIASDIFTIEAIDKAQRLLEEVLTYKGSTIKLNQRLWEYLWRCSEIYRAGGGSVTADNKRETSFTRFVLAIAKRVEATNPTLLEALGKNPGENTYRYLTRIKTHPDWKFCTCPADDGPK